MIEKINGNITLWSDSEQNGEALPKFLLQLILCLIKQKQVVTEKT